jgi:hypothetical protein
MSDLLVYSMAEIHAASHAMGSSIDTASCYPFPRQLDALRFCSPFCAASFYHLIRTLRWLDDNERLTYPVFWPPWLPHRSDESNWSLLLEMSTEPLMWERKLVEPIVHYL